jgi:lipase chaperone LimK
VRSPDRACQQDRRELVAAEAGDRIARTDRAPDPCRELLQHLVTDRMAVLVVDRLEVVEVDVQQRHLGALVLLEAALEERLEAGAVEDAGQDVAMRKLEQAAGLLPMLRDVLGDSRRSRRPSRRRATAGCS